MTESIKIDVLKDMESILISAVGMVKIIRIYKVRYDKTFKEEVLYSFILEDSSYRIKTNGYSSIIVLYERVTSNATFTWEKNKNSYGNFYSISFKKNNLQGKNLLFFDIDEVGDNNISANIKITTEDGDSLIYDNIISGEYAYSSIEKDAFIYESMVVNTNGDSSYGYVYKPKIVYDTDFINVRDKMITVIGKKYSVEVQIFIFRSDGLQIETSPVIKHVGLKNYE